MRVTLTNNKNSIAGYFQEYVLRNFVSGLSGVWNPESISVTRSWLIFYKQMDQ